MAIEDDRSVWASALEDRVARLEEELESLRRQIASAATSPQMAAQIARPAPPPPPLQKRLDAAPELPLQGLEPAAPVLAPPPEASPLQPPRASFEDRLGSQIFNRIGIVLVLMGTATFLKYAIDKQWLGPMGRVVAGLLAGAGIVLWSERFRKKGFAPFSYSLKALGSGVLYLSLWAAFHIYGLLPASVALGLMVLVTGWNAWMAWSQDSELLAAYALAGGFATPMLLSTGGNHEAFLFTYLLAIDIATVVLVRLRNWPRLLLGAFPLTMAFFIGWYAEFFAPSASSLTAMLIVLFDGTFSSVPIRPGVGYPSRGDRSTLIEDILLPLANSVFLAGGLYSVLQDSGRHSWLPWLMIVLSARYLGFMRLPQSKTASAIHLTIAIVLLTIAVPLKASGHWITVSWLVEGLALLWVAMRLTPAEPLDQASDAYASNTLRWLASGALLLGLCGIFVHSLGSGLVAAITFFNSDTATALIGVLAFATAAWLALGPSNFKAQTGALKLPDIAIACFVAIDLIVVLLSVREFSPSAAVAHAPFQSADFAIALVGLAVFAGVIAVSLRLARAHPEAAFWMNCAALSTIAFNLVAVLTGVHEINAIWDVSLPNTSTGPDALLQQALAISGFLMLYGAVLLAVGFWKRNAFLRWQALLLLVFTIFKAFLYDMRNLSQGYRVVSFLGLGALLMAISFAYQKDWLSLREPPPGESAADHSRVVE